jgi:hypothetical protein
MYAGVSPFDTGELKKCTTITNIDTEYVLNITNDENNLIVYLNELNE